MSNKKRIFKIHSWLGLISGIFILFFALSGAIILWHKQLHYSLNSNQVFIEPNGVELSYDSLKTLIIKQLPDFDFNGFPKVQRNSNEALAISVDQYDKYKTLFINPYNGEIIGETRNNTADWIYRFHYSFQLGLVGEWLALLFSLFLLGSVITGFIIYKKSVIPVLLFKIKLSTKNWRTTSSGLHRILGVWSLIFNFIMAFTGFYLMLYLFVPEDSKEIIPKKNNLDWSYSIDNALILAKDTFPDLTVNYIKTPRGKKDSTLSIWGNLKGSWHLGDYATNVDINVFTGKVTNATREKELDYLTQTQLTLSTLHFGHYGGLVSEIVYLIFALCTATISITGFLLWWRRKT